ncbi:MAG: zf-HC2 domain-containing protein [Pseudomonadota bacterium]
MSTLQFPTWRDRLQAYVDGSLDPTDAEEVEDALERSKALRAEHALMLREQAALRALFQAGGAETAVAEARGRRPEERMAPPPSAATPARNRSRAVEPRRRIAGDPPHALDRRAALTADDDRAPGPRAAARPASRSVQTRPDQARTDQARTNQARPDPERSAGGRRAAWSSIAAVLAIGVGFGGGLLLSDGAGDPMAALQRILDGEELAATRPAVAPVAPAAPVASAPGWKMSVAVYHRLFSKETLEAAPLSAAALDTRLERIGAAVDRRLLAASAPPSGFELRQAQLLTFDGRALGQIVFAGADGAPFALCVIERPLDAPAADPEAPPALETARLLDQSAVSWVDGRHAFLLIGQADDPEMLRIGAIFAQLMSLRG